MDRLCAVFIGLGAGFAAVPASAQTEPAVPPAVEAEDDSDTIIVTGGRIAGSVVGNIQPETTLSPADIRSFGVGSLSDLVAELAPQTTSDQGRGGESPIVLLNGKRISGFSEIRNIPTEAIQRVEILPEEVALKYGYPPNQKVVNVVLRRRFNTLTAELEAGAPTEGGQFSPEIETSYFHISEAGRLNVALEYERSSALYESERDIIPRSPEDVAGDTGRYRTLLPATDALTLNAVLARTIFGNVSATFNGTLSYNESDSAQGLGMAAFTPGDDPNSIDELDPLRQHSRDITGHFGTTLNGALGSWQWTFTGNYDHAVSRTTTEREYDLPDLQEGLVTRTLVDRARTNSDVGEAELVVTGSLFTLPAGNVTTTVTLGGATNNFTALSTRAAVTTPSDLSRGSTNSNISIDMPLASRRREVLAAIGDLSANFNFAYEHLSDFGGLRTFGAGINWSPVRPLSIIASVSRDEGAPTVQQLGNPLVAVSGARVFDYVLGETVDITRVTGGNQNLTADDRRVFKLGMTLKPLSDTDLAITTNYTNNRISDPIAAFPTATAALEDAFPNRFTRDSSGRLQQIDSRPINFARRDQERVRLGVNFSKQLSTPPRPPEGGERPNVGRGQRGGAGLAGLGRRQGPQGTRLQLAVYHTIYLREQILVYEGGTVLDLLNGDAINSSGGQARHQVQAQAGLTHNGLGGRLSASWRSGTSVDGGSMGTQQLRFSDIATLNVRLFADLGQQRELVSRWPFLQRTRLNFALTNLFNTRPHVRDVNGETPISYQPSYLDPLGRSVQLSFRKLF